MDEEKRKRLTRALAEHVTAIAKDLRPRLEAKGPVREAAEALRLEEKAGLAFDLWTDLLARRAAVMWVLKTVYIRVLEDRALLRPVRIVDPESQKLFEELAPRLGASAFLSWIFRDAGLPDGGLPELFERQPVELLVPGDACSRELIAFWRRRDPDTGELAYRFDAETFDGRLMGDLYQDLDPLVKKRYALLQTPDFVVDFILDQTLTPAIEEFGVREVRVLDPSCGSGHFLLAAFRRLYEALRSKSPELSPRDAARDVLARVVGIDLNDYACALARARLVMTALEISGERDLTTAGAFHPRVYWADALEQVERDDEWKQIGLDGIGDGEKPTGLMTRPEVRVALRPILKAGFHVVVGNPPYVTEKDEERKAYHRAKQDKRRRYLSAAGKYSLGAPFTERMFQLSSANGYVGEIVADSFMKREFGEALIEEVLAKETLTLVVNAAGAHIPGHGTPTALLFARHAAPPKGDTVRVVMAKRSEPGKPKDPANGKVWSSIVAGYRTAGFENEFVSVSDVPRAVLDEHEWSIGGGGAAELKEKLDAAAIRTLDQIAMDVGFDVIPGEQDAYLGTEAWIRRLALTRSAYRQAYSGDAVRDWGLARGAWILFPYDDELRATMTVLSEAARAHLWSYRTLLRDRVQFGKTTEEAGLQWFEFRSFYKSKRSARLTIAFGEVATHNHFALERDGSVFDRPAPVIKLSPSVSESDHLALLGQLNASTACFWMKQVCQDKAGSGIDRGIQPEAWMSRFQFGGTKLLSFPVIAERHELLEGFATELDALARQRVEDSARAVIDATAERGKAALRAALDARAARDIASLHRMVGLQEELDWLCYKLYGIDTGSDVRKPTDVSPLVPGQRPFEITLAIADVERREEIAEGGEPDEMPTAWFERHGWTPITDVASLPAKHRAIVEGRIERTAASRELGLLEQPAYKRRWYRPDHGREEKDALGEWLDDRVERWARDRAAPFTAEDAARALGAEAAVLAVVALLSARDDFDLEAVIAERLTKASVPNVKHHVYKPSGLVTRALWEKTWALQREEDEGKKPKIEPPPHYKRADFQADFWLLRGELDVPKERFIALTEITWAKVPLYGWAGWTPRESAKALLDLDERAEESGVPVAERIGLLHGVWFQLPYVAWESKGAADEFRSVVRSLLGEAGVTEAMLDAWATEHPRAKKKPSKGKVR